MRSAYGELHRAGFAHSAEAWQGEKLVGGLYGVSLGGLTALFAMLHSCVPGVAVVNIDNGFGAGCMAHKINLLARPDKKNGKR